MKIKPRRRLVEPADELSAPEELAPSNGADDSGNGAHDLDVALEAEAITGNGAQAEDVALEAAGNGTQEAGLPLDTQGNGAHDSAGMGNGRAKASGSTSIMLPKRRKPVGTGYKAAPPAVTTAAIATEDEVEVAPPRVTPQLPPRRRKAALSTETATTPTPPPAPLPTSAPRPTRRRLLGDDGSLRVFLTYENLFWFGMFALTIATRFWDLAPRGIHHDESLHAHFSRQLYDGTGYIHDPMMHGPLQFHLIALMYWLFGTTDATARFASVVCGIFVVMSPFFLRRQMGRIPAMVATFLLFISPSILYFSRMAREDAIFSGMEMIMMVGLWRFVSERKPTDFVIFMAGLSLMFTIKETAYLTLLILAAFFLVMFAIQAGYAVLGALVGYGAALGALYLYVNSGMKTGSIPKLPDIPQVSPNFDTIWQFMGAFFGHPLVWGAILLTVLFLAGVTVMLSSQRGRSRPAFVGTGAPIRRSSALRESSGVPTRRVSTTVASDGSQNGHDVVQSDEAEAEESDEEMLAPDDASPVYDPREMRPSPGSATARYQPGSIPYLIGALFSRPSVLITGLGVALAIYATLYTVFFTDIPRGLISGPFGSLGYWMAQHDVVRGDQPWFYYLLLIPLYEPVGVFFSLVAIIFFTWRGISWFLRRWRGDIDRDEPLPQRLGAFNTDRPVPFASFSSFLPTFLIVWLLGTVTIYSWAGEKMPWLMMHMVRPFIFLAALFIGALVISLLKRRRERLAEEEWYDYVPDEEEEPIAPRGPLPTRRHSPAMQSRQGKSRWDAVTGAMKPQRSLALAGAGASASGTPPQVVAMSRGYAPPPPPRRRGSGRMVEQPVYYDEQEPPWVTWSRPGSRFPIASFLTIFIILTLAWGLKLNAFTHFQTYGEWGMSWIYPLLIFLVTVGYAVWIGPGRAFKYLALGILSVGLMYQFRSSVNLSYNQPDVPLEMATYVQTSPHVVSMIRNLEEYADYAAPALTYPGGSLQGPKKSLKVMYDSFTSWPMEWYLRDYDKTFIGGGEATPGSDVPILMLEYAKHNNKENLTKDYQVIRYPMRWWFPEEWYKDEFIPNRWAKDAQGNSVTDPETGKRKESPLTEQIGGALGTVIATVREPQLHATLWKYLTFRETPKPLGSEDMLLFVRKDVAQAWHRIQYEPPITPPDVEPRALPEKEWWQADPLTGD